MSMKILTYLVLALLIIATCFANRADKSNGAVEARGETRRAVLQPRAGRSGDRRTLILLMPEEENLRTLEEENASLHSTKTKRCKTPTRRVRLSVPTNGRHNSPRIRQTDEFRSERQHNDRKEHALAHAPSVRIIPLRDPKAMLRSGLVAGGSSPEGIGNRRENVGLLKVLEDNLKPRQGEISATNKRRQRAKPAVTDDSRYVCYCREENEDDANSPKGLSENPLLQQPHQRKNKCGRKQPRTQVIARAPPRKSSPLEIPGNRFIPQGFPVLYPNVPQIPRYPINMGEQVGASLPVGDGIAGLPYLPVVYKMQPKLTVPASSLTGDSPVGLNIPAPTDNDFFIGQAHSNKIKPTFPCVSVTEGSEYEPTSLSDASDSEDSISSVPRYGEDEIENAGSHSTESAEDPRVGMAENQWPSSMEQANFEECIKLYGRKVCVISGTPTIHPKQGSPNFEDDSQEYPVKNESNEDCENESDSGVSEPKPGSHEYDKNDNNSENDNTYDIIAAKHDEPEDNFSRHEPDINLGKGTSSGGTLDYSDIQEVTATYFTSKAYENETNVTDFVPSSFDDLYTTSSGTEDVNEQEDTVGATPPGPNSNNDADSQFNTEEIITIKSDSKIMLTTETSPVSKEEYPDTQGDELGQGASNNIPEQGRASNNDATYDDNVRDATVGVQNTENENFPAPSDSSEKDFSPDRKSSENPKVGQSIYDDISVERTTHLSTAEETIESRDEGTLENTPCDTTGNKDKVPESQDSVSTNDESILGNSGNTENVGAVDELPKSNEENSDTADSVTVSSTYGENTNILTGAAPNTDNTGEDESWKAVLPFCDNTMLQNSIKTVINNFVNKNAENAKETNDETVGSPHNDLLAEVLEVPNLKNVLSVPQIETMIVERVKDMVAEVSGVPRKDLSNDWSTNVIKSNLNHMMPGAKSRTNDKLPPMTVKEREFKDGAWQTHFATIAPVSGTEQKALSELEKVKHNMRNLLDDPAVGMQAAKHPIVQNMIIQTIRSHYHIEETKIRRVLDHMVGQMKDTENNEEDTDEDKLINTDSAVKPANDEAYYDDDAPDVIADTEKTEDELTDNPEDPKLGSSHKETPETIPVENEKPQGEGASPATDFYEKKILETTVSPSPHDIPATTDTSTYKLSKEEDASKFLKVSCTTDDTYAESSTDLKESNKDADNITNPMETNDENALGSAQTISHNEPQLNSNLPDDEKGRDEQVGSENSAPAIDTGTSIDDNDNLEQVVGDSPTKFYSPNDRILNYIKNHQTGAAKAGGDPQDGPDINRDEQASTTGTSHISETDYTEGNEEATVSTYADQAAREIISQDSGSSDSPNVGITQSVDTCVTESRNPGLTETPGLPTLEDNLDDQTQDTSLVGKPLTNSPDSETGSIASRTQFRTDSRNNHQTTKPQYLKTHEVTTTDIQKVTKTTRYFLPNGKAENENAYEPDGPTMVIEEQSDESGLVGAPVPEGSEASEDYTYFGKIVPNKANYPDDMQGLQQSDLFFVGDGVRLPLEIRKQSDGSYALTISRKVCDRMLRKECPCCVPRQGNVVRSIRRNGAKENQKYSLHETNGKLYRTVRPARKTQGRQIMRPITLNDRVKRASANDSTTISMPVEVFAKKYNLSLDLKEIEAFGAWYKRGNSNRSPSDDENDYPSRNSSPVDDSSRSKKPDRFSSIEQSDEIDNDKDLYVVIDGKPTRIRHLDWDTIDSREFSHRKDPIVDRIKYSREDQRAPVRYRYHRNVDGSSDRRTEVAKNVLNWFRDLFLNANPDVSRRK